MIDIKVIASSSSGNCYLIDDGKTKLLLDAGVHFKEILKACDFCTSGISGSLITHNHNDHAQAVDMLLRRGVNVYGNIETTMHHDGMRYIQSGRKIGIGTFDIIAQDISHDIPCYCYYLHSLATNEVVLYVTDAQEVPYRFADVGYLLIEANYDYELLQLTDKPISLKSRIVQTHLSIDQTAAFVQGMNQDKLKEIYLCHLSDEDSDAELFRNRIEDLTQAKVYICEKNGGVSCKK